MNRGQASEDKDFRECLQDLSRPSIERGKGTPKFVWNIYTEDISKDLSDNKESSEDEDIIKFTPDENCPTDQNAETWLRKLPKTTERPHKVKRNPFQSK